MSSKAGSNNSDAHVNQLQVARSAARERYVAIAEAMKAEAGITRHHVFKQIGGLAWSGTGRILAPEGVTRRQLYVLAHECGHNVLHGTPFGVAKAAHVKEHEAETYAHRAFARYGLDVPEKSARWARAYVGLWIMKDRAAGVPICPMAADWASGKRSPHEPLPSVDGQPPNDFSKSIERFVAKGTKLVEAEEAMMRQQIAETAAYSVPNACGTCLYFRPDEKYFRESRCSAFNFKAVDVRNLHSHCNNGEAWRPSPKAIRELMSSANASRGNFLSRLAEAVLDRISGRYLLREIDQSQRIEPPQKSTVVLIEDGAKSKKSKDRLG